MPNFSSSSVSLVSFNQKEVAAQNMHLVGTQFSVAAVLLLIFMIGERLSRVDALICMPCNNVACIPPKDCNVGKVKDPCNCCEVCAKKKGQTCGGPWEAAGKCGVGLRCATISIYPVSGICVPL